MSQSYRPLLFVLALVSCTTDLQLPSDVTILCANDAQCPNGRRCLLATGVCVEDNGACVESTPNGLVAVADGLSCQKSSGGNGVCYRGICRDEPCGDGVLDIGEVCDDGNARGGDGCSADCRKIEVCGDKIQDEGETCDNTADDPNDPNDGCDACRLTAWTPTVVLGSRQKVADAPLVGPVVADRRGRIIAGGSFCRIYEIDEVADTATVIAGSGTCRTSGDDLGLDAQARGTNLGRVTALALDNAQNVYFAYDGFIGKIDRTSGVLTRVAGTGVVCSNAGACPSGGDPDSTSVGVVNGLAVSYVGAVYYSEFNLHDVREIPASRARQTVIIGTPGTFGPSADNNVSGTSVLLTNPSGLATDKLGTKLFVMDTGRYRAMTFDVASRMVQHVAGTGVAATSTSGATAATSPMWPYGDIHWMRNGDLIIRESFAITVITSGGTYRRVAGNGLSASGAGAISPSAVTAFDNGDALFIEGTTDGMQFTNALRTIRNGDLTTLTSSVVRNVVASGLSATSVPLRELQDFAFGANGDIYLVTQREVLRRDGATGDLHVIGGTGTSRDEGALLATFNFVNLIAVEYAANGDLLLLDQGLNTVFRVGSDNRVSVIAGAPGLADDPVDGGQARNGRFESPSDMRVAANGDIYIADYGHRRIRRIRNGIITTYSGNGEDCDQPCTGTMQASGPVHYTGGHFFRIAILNDADVPDIVFTDQQNYQLRLIRGGTVTTLAGPSTGASLDTLAGLAVYDGGLAVLDNYVRYIKPIQSTTPMVRFAIHPTNPGYAGDGGPALNALGRVTRDSTVRTGPDGLYFIDGQHLRRIDATGVITTLAGAVDPYGDGPAATGELGHPQSVVAFADNRYLITDGTTGRVRLFDDATQRLQTVMGYPSGAFSGLGGSARYSERLLDAWGAAITDNMLYVSDAQFVSIRTMTLSGQPSTWTNGAYIDNRVGYADGPIAVSRYARPMGLAAESDGRALWIADSTNHVLRKIDLGAGVASTEGGDVFIADQSGDGGPLRNARFSSPTAIAFNPFDQSLYIADTGNNCVRRAIAVGGKVTGDSIVETVIGNGAPADVGSGAPANALPTLAPSGLAFDGSGNLWVTTATTMRLVVAGPDGIATGGDRALTVYGLNRSTYPESVTQCLSAVIARPGDASAYVFDSCQGMMIRLDRNRTGE